MTEQLKDLWQATFGDSREFVDLFFSTAYSEDRCQILTEDGQVTAALYWLDCRFRGQKQAYIYAVATHPNHRGKGLCRKLMAQIHEVLKTRGYTAALLKPGEDGLIRMYEKLGYRICTHLQEFSCDAGTPVPLRLIAPAEYARIRRQYLPEYGLLQEEENLRFLASCCSLYAGADFLCCGGPEDGAFRCLELLGNRSAAPGILAALGYENGVFRIPGREVPFAMGLKLTEDAVLPGYLGLAFD